MKLRIALALAIVSHFCFAAENRELHWELLPKGRPFQLTFADPREIRMGISFEGQSRLSAAIGNYFSLVALEPDDKAWSAHFGIEGAAFFGLRQSESRFPLETTDGLIGVYTEAAQGPFQLQLRYTHISAHLADGSVAVPIAYSREFLALRVGYLAATDLHLYTGVLMLMNSVPPVHPWGWQGGGTYFIPWGPQWLKPFVGIDVKWRGESSVNPSLNAQIGFALNNPPSAYRSFRVFYSYFTGSDPRGQFLNRSHTAHAFGIEMQI